MPGSAPVAQKINGVYRLNGGHEMVAVFEFSGDSSFHFGYIYGAVDRSSSGHFLVRDGKIFLKADKKAGKDFTIVHQEQRGEGSTIRITDKNTYLVKGVTCLFKKNGQQDVQYSDEEGMVHSTLSDCDSILIVHPLFPDAPTVIRGEGTNNYFELTLNPSLAEVSFKDVVLTIGAEGLTAVLPELFEREKALFVKQKD